MKKEKKHNKGHILRYLYECGDTSKQSISKALELSMPTTLKHVKTLIGDGFIKESGAYASTGGRKASILRVIPSIRYAIGIDITAGHIGFALVDISGKAIIHERLPRKFETSDSYYTQLAIDVRELLKRYNIPEHKLIGVGIAIPGVLDSSGARIEFSHVLQLREFLCSKLSEPIKYPCIFENDANASGIAEHKKLSVTSPMAYLSLSNSVGGAFYPDGSLYSGSNQRSSEFGHMCLVPNGRKCYCGKNGCADAYCSATILSDPFGGQLKTFFLELCGGNVQALRIWKSYTDDLSVHVNNLRMALDCYIVLGGYVGGYLEKYLADIREKVSWLNTFEFNGDYLLPCFYKEGAAAIGAALRWIDIFIDSID